MNPEPTSPFVNDLAAASAVPVSHIGILWQYSIIFFLGIVFIQWNLYSDSLIILKQGGKAVVTLLYIDNKL